MSREVLKSITQHIGDSSHIASIYKDAARLLEDRGIFTGSVVRSVMTCVSEMSYNLDIHSSHGGTITISIITENQYRYIEIISEDIPAGMSEEDAEFQQSSLEKEDVWGGLPGIKRIMDEFNVFIGKKNALKIVAKKLVGKA